MAKRILVVGGTGMLGEPVARRLAADGFDVRVLSRNPEGASNKFGEGFDVVGGDVDDLSSLEQALDGCFGVHLNLDGKGDWDLEPRGAANVSKVAARLDVQRITIITGASTREENCWFPMTKAKFEAENALRESGVPFTIFRCTMFMELMPNFVRGGKAMVMGPQPNLWHIVAADDYARMVATAYETPEAAGKTLYVYGPEALTFEQALDIYTSICAPGAKLMRVPFWMLWIMARFPGRQQLRHVGLPLMRYFSKVGESGDSTKANELLGAPATTLERWCRSSIR